MTEIKRTMIASLLIEQATELKGKRPSELGFDELIDVVQAVVKLFAIPIVSHRISGLSARKKNKLFAIWMSKERIEGSETLDIMFALDDEWQKVYQEYRIKEDFSAAALRANERLLDIVYGG